MNRSWHACPLLLLTFLLVFVSASATLAQKAAAGGPPAPAGVRALIAQLSSPDLQLRRDAARQLAAIEPMPPEVIRTLANFLQTAEKNDADQRYAIMGLARTGAPALAAAAHLLNSPNGVTREAAREILGRMAPTVPATWPILIAYFKQEPLGPWFVAYELARAGPPLVPLLRQALKAPDQRTRMGAAATLAEMADFARTYRNSSEQSRRQKEIAFATGHDLTPAAPELAHALDDPDPGVRNWAAIALAYADPTDSRSIPILAALLNEKDFIIRGEAISALQNMGSAAKPAVPALERALASNPDDGMRVGAARALLLAAGPDACGALARAVTTDKAANVRVWAARSLSAIHPHCPQTLAALLETLGNRQYSATDELAKIGAPAVPGLLKALGSANLYVRQDSVAALAQMKPMPPEAKHALMVALRDKSLDVRSAAARALQDAGGAEHRAAEAEEAREEKISAQESKPDTRKYTLQRIIAPVPVDADHVYPLTLSYLVSVVASGEPIGRAQILIALYSGRDRPERLVFWRKVGRDTYQKARVIESQDPDFREQHYETPEVFTAGVSVLGQGAPRTRTELFVDVPVDGWRSRTDQVFAVVGGRLHPVEIQSAQKWYKLKLPPREGIRYPAANSFSDDELSFSMSIWNADDPMCCPSAGGVAGTYKIVEEAAAPGAEPTWKMIVASAKRETPAPRRQLPKKPREDKLTIWTREAHRGSPPSLSELLVALKSPDLRDRNAAAIMLRRVNPLPAKAIRALAETLGTPDPHNQFQFATFDTLSRGGAAAIPAIAQLTHSDDPQKRRLAFQALGRMGRYEPAAWPLLINALKSADTETAQSELANIGDSIVPLLRKSLKDSNPRVRAGAAAALAKMANFSREIEELPPRLRPSTIAYASPAVLDGAKFDLAEALNDPDSDVRSQAAIALASVDPRDKRAVPGLAALIGAKDPKLREAALTTLQLVGSAAKKIIPAIERVLENDPEPGARGQAARTLAAIAGAQACPALAHAAANDKNADVRTGVMAVMARESPACPQALPALIGTLGKNQGVDRALTCYSLARLGKSAVPRLAEALKSPDLRVRQDAVHALAQMNPLTPQAVDALMVALEDKSPDVRSLAAETLQNAGGEAKQAGAAELKREQQILARQSKLDTRRYRKEDIMAPIPPCADHAHPLTLACLLPLYRYGGSARDAQFLVSVHRGTDGPERLAFWKRTGDDQYQLLKVFESQGRDAVARRFGTPTFFVAKLKSSYPDWYSFVDVPVDGRQGRRDRVFVLDGDRVSPVEIESPEKWYQGKLGKKEAIRGPVANSFTSEGLKFALPIWKASDRQHRPAAGWVVGTYRVELERLAPGASAGPGAISISGPGGIGRGMFLVRGIFPGQPTERIWKMVVDTAEWEPGGSR
jgi:HEAT repeat protein